jgi:hypothetical protein
MTTPGYNPGAAEDPTTSPDIVDPSTEPTPEEVSGQDPIEEVDR